METLTPDATLDWPTLLATDWDVVVVGAGPAGLATALESTRQGLNTLLLDRQSFPRDKVCGGCMNAVALDQLAALGLGDLPDQLGAVTVDRFRLGIRGRQIALDLPPGRALSRRVFDTALLNEALKRGVQFMPGVSVTDAGCSPTHRHLRLNQPQRTATISARWVVAADGLGVRGHRQRPDGGPEPDIADRPERADRRRDARPRGPREGLTMQMICEGHRLIDADGHVHLVVNKPTM